MLGGTLGSLSHVTTLSVRDTCVHVPATLFAVATTVFFVVFPQPHVSRPPGMRNRSSGLATATRDRRPCAVRCFLTKSTTGRSFPFVRWVSQVSHRAGPSARDSRLTCDTQSTDTQKNEHHATRMRSTVTHSTTRRCVHLTSLCALVCLCACACPCVCVLLLGSVRVACVLRQREGEGQRCGHTFDEMFWKF